MAARPEEYQQLLDPVVAVWASGLTPKQHASILTAVYSVPGLIQALQYTPAQPAPARPTEVLPTYAGQVGEEKFEDLCRDLPANYSVSNTSKLGHAGDFVVDYTDGGRVYRCIVDIKNYRGTVPRREVDKLLTDAEYGNYDCALMVSYDGKIVGQAERVALATATGGSGAIPIMYLSRVPPSLVLVAIETLMVRVAVQTETTTNLGEISAYISAINIALQQSSMTRGILSSMSTTLQGQIAKCQENLIGCELQVKHAVRNLETSVRKQGGPAPVTLARLPTIPAPPPPRENLADSPASSVVDLPVQPSEGPVDPEPSPYEDINLDAYRSEDIGIMMGLIALDDKWEDILHGDNGDIDFDGGDKGLFAFLPRKTFTRVQVDEITWELLPGNFQKLFTKKETKKATTYWLKLNQTAADHMATYVQ
jgi:hypothetical protein